MTEREQVTPAPDSHIDPLWTVTLPEGGGLLTPLAGGVVVSSGSWLSAYAADGRLVWQAGEVARTFGGSTVLTPEGLLLRIEDQRIVTRTLASGQVVGLLPAPNGSGLAVAPWGDLLYSAAAPGGTAVLRCLTRDGTPRWVVALDGPAPLVYGPLPLGQVVVVPRRGALWALDRDGRCPWLADPGGVRAAGPADDQRAPASGVELAAAPVRFDDRRAVVALESDTGRGLYLIDAGAPALTPLAVPAPASPPYQALVGAQPRIVGLGPQVEVAHMDWRYPVVCLAPGGATVWQHLLPARATTLAATPDGGVVAAASASTQRWQDYQRWYDLSAETFVRCLGPDGRARWTWHAHGPLTHQPVVGPEGIAYVGSEQRLHALRVDSTG
jgi:hypothetical protein